MYMYVFIHSFPRKILEIAKYSKCLQSKIFLCMQSSNIIYLAHYS